MSKGFDSRPKPSIFDANMSFYGLANNPSASSVDASPYVLTSFGLKNLEYAVWVNEALGVVFSKGLIPIPVLMR